MLNSAVNISLNGDTVAISESQFLSEVLQQQGYQTQKIAVAINGEFVSRSLYVETLLNNGDAIDVIQAVGGG